MSTVLPPEVMARGLIRLRKQQLSDAEALFECCSDPEVVRYMDWPACTSIEPMIERMRQRGDQWPAGVEFKWVMTLPDADRAVGSVSCSVEEHVAEFGFFVNRRDWGKGYATEASRAIVEWAMSVPTIWRVWATCDSENLASARVLENAGLTREGTLRRWLVRPNISSEPRDAFAYSRVR